MNEPKKTTVWARAGGGFWRRERGAVLWVRTHISSTDLAKQTGSLRLEVFYRDIFVLQDTHQLGEEAGKHWCDKWANILIRTADDTEAEQTEPKLSQSAAQQDAELLSRMVGRKKYEAVFVNDKGTKQTPTVYVLADGRAYAPILGFSAPLYPTLDSLCASLAEAFGPGFTYGGIRWTEQQ